MLYETILGINTFLYFRILKLIKEKESDSK